MRPLFSPEEGRATAIKRALAVFNKQARTVADNIDAVLEALQSRGIEAIQADCSTRESVAKAIVRHAGDVDALIAAGGDGTLNAVLQGLIKTKLPLGIVPLGTANDLCKTLGIPVDPNAACDVIAAGHSRRIDVGRVNGIYYFNEASIGLSVTLTRKLTPEAKKRLGVLAHVIAAMKILRRMRRFRVAIEAGDQPEIVVHSAQLTVGNSRNFGGLLANEEAKIDDRRLDLYSVEFRHWWGYLEALISVLRRRYDDAKSVLTMHGRRFNVRTRRTMSIEADGEVVSTTPAVFEVIPLSVSVFVPEPESVKP